MEIGQGTVYYPLISNGLGKAPCEDCVSKVFN